MSRYCNAYGAENPGGHSVPFGGFLPNSVSVQPVCDRPAVHRFRWVCEHGHEGPIVKLCQQHHAEFSGSASVPRNIRRDVQSCPRCAAEAPDCTNPEHIAMYRGRPGACGCQQHKCAVRLVTVS